MAHWLESQLFRWARLSMRQRDGGAGYGLSGLANMMPRANSASGGGVWDTTAVEHDQLNRAINALPERLRVFVVVYYQRTDGSKRQTGRTLEVSPSTVTVRLSEAHTAILDYLRRDSQQEPWHDKTGRKA